MTPKRRWDRRLCDGNCPSASIICMRGSDSTDRAIYCLMLSFSDSAEIAKCYVGKYCFGCTLPGFCKRLTSGVRRLEMIGQNFFLWNTDTRLHNSQIQWCGCKDTAQHLHLKIEDSIEPVLPEAALVCGRELFYSQITQQPVEIVLYESGIHLQSSSLILYG